MYGNALSDGVRHFRSVVMIAGSRGTTAHAHQCCIFQSYAKTVPSRMKLTMREPASMTTDKGSRCVTSYFYGASVHEIGHVTCRSTVEIIAITFNILTYKSPDQSQTINHRTFFRVPDGKNFVK